MAPAIPSSLRPVLTAFATRLRRIFGVRLRELRLFGSYARGAELIYTSADATKLFMGLTTWKDAPHGKILKSDVTVAKNYLSEAHVKELNRIVSAYLDLAENRAQRRGASQ